MYITNDQMHNVLKIYTDQLYKFRAPVSESLPACKPNADVIAASADGTRQNLIDRIAADIVARIRNGGGQSDGEPTMTESLGQEPNDRNKISDTRNDTFVYNVIRGESAKKTHTLSVEDADFLARRFEELARKMMDRRAHSFSV
jgi:hypothetical protein